MKKIICLAFLLGFSAERSTTDMHYGIGRNASNQGKKFEKKEKAIDRKINVSQKRNKRSKMQTNLGTITDDELAWTIQMMQALKEYDY